ncbi:MAG: hypothetical protein KUG83_00055 [Gammaproteobacteria bacterium]|nr:hypothetical protein [Gammaproteobacteria bacterium]
MPQIRCMPLVIVSGGEFACNRDAKRFHFVEIRGQFDPNSQRLFTVAYRAGAPTPPARLSAGQEWPQMTDSHRSVVFDG